MGLRTPVVRYGSQVRRTVHADHRALVPAPEGPPLVLVHGRARRPHALGCVAAHLEPHVTVHAIDRRGRGASGDGPHYAVEREFEDVAHTIPRELQIPPERYFDPERAAEVTVPTLLLVGADSPDHLKADTEPVVTAVTA